MATKIQKVIQFDTIDEICPIPATEFNPEQVEGKRNYYAFERFPKYDKYMPSQAELMEKVNGKYITFEQFITEILPIGQMWISCNGEAIYPYLSWEPGYVRFTEYGRKEYAGLLKCIVEVCAQGFLYLHYNNYNKAHDFVSDMRGLTTSARRAAVFG